MKDKKKKLIVLICFFLVIGMIWFMDTDRYIRDNIITIDKVDSIYIVTEDKIVSYPFNEKLIELVSYGGVVVKADNFFIELFAAYSNNLTKVDMNIRYNCFWQVLFPALRKLIFQAPHIKLLSLHYRI